MKKILLSMLIVLGFVGLSFADTYYKANLTTTTVTASSVDGWLTGIFATNNSTNTIVVYIYDGVANSSMCVCDLTIPASSTTRPATYFYPLKDAQRIRYATSLKMASDINTEIDKQVYSSHGLSITLFYDKFR